LLQLHHTTYLYHLLANCFYWSSYLHRHVYTLCNDMAIIGNGEVLLSDAPRKVEESLRGRCWVKAIERDELERHHAEHDIIANHFHLGQLNITVVDEKAPGDGFEIKEPTLEDAYFHMLARQKAAKNGK
ncbi:MAG: hypothetical protein AAGB19_16200, partial [Cyanobacteria bacterium P01_F01_bin.3]